MNLGVYNNSLVFNGKIVGTISGNSAVADYVDLNGLHLSCKEYRKKSEAQSSGTANCSTDLRGLLLDEWCQ
jgi:hypothetical protein